MIVKVDRITDYHRDAEVESAERVLLEIADDARKVKNRYAKETEVAEGGE
jgi:hypothetical protein